MASFIFPSFLSIFKLYEECRKESLETRHPYLVPRTDPCIPTHPVYGQCDSGGNSVQDVSDPVYGAVAYLMAGSVPGMNYEIVISCKGISTSFWSHSTEYGNCYGHRIPKADLRLSSYSYVDQHGDVISAMVPGEKLPM